ncbi:MAG: D-tyrosyl-tRNA(Tyr) deacylase [candidate division Zixibacteria bacterium]|nr:D-tyrosyl-tRNA(Tyr) deacylase [candidate division Zixibacteria bacterium]NIR67927.1 D-tyrosyl-tRNA(Tyr) deacylase [candidate division Zixibacteria bacterium]NIS16290.1 D-tyrosyl-tRNA(Tyr) deacylase [candidate division Zixibacteria bacterium]NIS49144.1 D-tyrosyl-tRNA(Tyr) deacylase [candidate division Zixibacteria bacterium]NIT53652.1 D-tyrosyl-tRNA(Tyr) deacylase [candidate division Zixibacteria bacterium]
MRVVVQRVKNARVSVENRIIGEIGPGLVLLVGAAEGDTSEDVRKMAYKCLNMRIFEDKAGKMNLSCLKLGYDVLIISQFTLIADTRKGHRPSFSGALEPEQAEKLYHEFVEACRAEGLKVAEGEFGAHMLVEINNWGPVTIIVDSKS